MRRLQQPRLPRTQSPFHWRMGSAPTPCCKRAYLNLSLCKSPLSKQLGDRALSHRCSDVRSPQLALSHLSRGASPESLGIAGSRCSACAQHRTCRYTGKSGHSSPHPHFAPYRGKTEGSYSHGWTSKIFFCCVLLWMLAPGVPEEKPTQSGAEYSWNAIQRGPAEYPGVPTPRTSRKKSESRQVPQRVPPNISGMPISSHSTLASSIVFTRQVDNSQKKARPRPKSSNDVESDTRRAACGHIY